ncbi:hypothetical protein VHEMI07765 [[Torrubiella] hemipterigena]|uniref:Uncharacterized protein n=1 Tax=[Torrubiella] hemipterigena TaxID=1531966 RepID=A0A0A1TM92_9HYPO|nr:hypothetical protein VHEMI07765 [[Torrubiella] hemipterigena]
MLNATTTSPLHREKRPRRTPTSATSTPPRTLSYTSIAGLASSEPTLRFPRPTGNKHLAHWISNSDPDIMHPTTDRSVDELSGIMESAYDIVGADLESTDEGNFTESMSASISSLDYHKMDDVVSLTGTEATYEEDEVDDTTASQFIEHIQANMIYSTETAIKDRSDSDEEDIDEGGDASQASLDYADSSLKTPSINTPEGSKIFVRQTILQTWVEGTRKFVNSAWREQERFRGVFVDTLCSALPGVICASLCGILIHIFFTPLEYPASPLIFTSLSTLTSTTTINLAPPASTTTTTVTTAAAMTLATGVALIPLSNPTESLFTSRRTTVSFTSQGKDSVLVHVGEDAKTAWARRSCLSITASREGQPAEISTTSVNEGILVQFPRREVHGMITMSVKATCRPKITKEVKVYFGKGIMVEAFEKGKQLAQEVSVAAQEAERRFNDVKESVVNSFDGSWSRALRYQSLFAREHLQKSEQTLRQQIFTASQQAASLTHDAVKNLNTQFMFTVQAVQVDLLEAQIKSKLWWLKLTGESEKYKSYEQKALSFLTEKQSQLLMAKKTETKQTSTLLSGWEWLQSQQDNFCNGQFGKWNPWPRQC